MAGRKIGELGEWRHRVGVLDHEMAKANLPALHLYAVGGLAEIWHGIAGTRTEDLDVEVRNVTHMDSATQMLEEGTMGLRRKYSLNMANDHEFV